MAFRKARIAIPSLIVLVAVAAGGAELWAEHEARRHVDETLASLPAGTSGHYDNLSYNLFTQTLRVSGLSIAHDGQPLFAFNRVVLHHLSGSGVAGSPFHATALSAVDVDLWRRGHHIKIGSVAARDIALLAPGEPAPPGTPPWLSGSDFGTPVTVGSVQLSTISTDQGTSIVALAAAGYTPGHLREASLSQYADAPGNAAESASATDIDLDGLDRVFNPARYAPNAPSWPAPRPLLGHLEFSNVTGHGRHGQSHLDSLTLDGLAARPFAQSPTQEALATPAFMRDAAEAVAVSNATLVNLSFSDSASGTATSLGHASLTGYQDGAVGRFTFARLNVSNHNQPVTALDRFEVSGLNATALLHASPDADAADIMALAQKGGIRLSSLTAEGLSYKFTTGSQLTLGRFSESLAYGPRLQATIMLDALSIPAAATPELGQLLQPLGVDPLTLSLKERASLDMTSGDATFDQFELSGKDLGKVSLTGNFSNLPLGLPQQISDPMSTIGQIGIGSFSLTFTNDGVVQRVIGHMAQQAGKTPADVTAEARAAASFFAAALVPGQADAGQQIGTFLASPKTLTLTASPVAPVPVATLEGPNFHAAQAALNLHLTAN